MRPGTPLPRPADDELMVVVGDTVTIITGIDSHAKVAESLRVLAAAHDTVHQITLGVTQ